MLIPPNPAKPEPSGENLTTKVPRHKGKMKESFVPLCLGGEFLAKCQSADEFGNLVQASSVF
jgi:hypothetical protein